ncbi:MAG TPA: hypothetical protein PK152_17525 [Anaerolineales bacterium]|jgi:hypothetical protein|nr:hypothetical protein [Anaerolineae bacterium]HRJ56748.1 hypothetical protein [Anaerolineales bacterium]HRK90932.1 hypothetical protein [Anaerolineales bacterium]
MFDDLRNDAASKPFYEEGEATYQPASSSYSSGTPGRFLGMTSFQRFVLVFLLMMATCIIGSLALFVFGKFVL